MAEIRAEALSIEFPLYHVASRSLKKRLLARAAIRVKTDEKSRIVVSALRELTLRIGHGERVALLGHNGAGKSTLLRTLSGIYEPVGGKLTVSGSIGSLIDPGAGMDPDSTGRENIRLRGYYRGLNTAALEAMEEEVAEFSGLNEFLDIPVRGYSAGMTLRLAFAMATAMQPQVLLMDEWFSTGDADFMARAQKRLAQLVQDAEILVVATHDLDVARRWCNRGILLEKGRIRADGPIGEVLDIYRQGPTG